MVTNQAGVARGHYGIEDVQQVHKHMIAELARHGAHVDLWLFCPYHPDGIVEAFARASADRKPGPGMALAAANALDLDLAASWVVGDRISDLGLARAVGARPLFVGPATCPDTDVTSFPDLAGRGRLHPRRGERAAPGRRPGPPGRPSSPRTASTRPTRSAARTSPSWPARSARWTSARSAARRTSSTAAYTRDAVVFSCGNGGSASIANHLQCDHVKGIRNGTDLTPRVVSLSTNVELLTAIANDLSYDAVFEYQLQSQARPGDVLIAVSSSGRSPNIVRALDWARANGMQTIALTGFEGGAARRTAGVSVHVDSTNYGVIEDAHQACMHLLAQYVRQSRMSTDAVAATTF